MSLYNVVGTRLVAQDARPSEGGLEAKQVIAIPGTEPIGTGKPLSIILRHLYTGRYPKPGTFGGSRKDVLITSAVRDVFGTFSAAPRAINILRRRVSRGSNITGVEANESGTPLVFYSPAVTAVSTTATIEMAFDDYPDELVSRIGGAMVSGGSIPLFGPYGGAIIGVGLAVKLVSSLINSLSDSKAEFGVSERLEFELPGGGDQPAGYRVLCQESFDPSDLEFVLGTGLVEKNSKKPYTGDEPYIVILVDGKKQEAFKDFVPTAATAAVLGRFLQEKDGSEVVINSIVDAVKLSSDLRFRREADKLAEALKGVKEGSPEHETLKKKLDAFVANIGEQLLKPGA